MIDSYVNNILQYLFFKYHRPPHFMAEANTFVFGAIWSQMSASFPIYHSCYIRGQCNTLQGQRSPPSSSYMSSQSPNNGLVSVKKVIPSPHSDSTATFTLLTPSNGCDNVRIHWRLSVTAFWSCNRRNLIYKNRVKGFAQGPNNDSLGVLGLAPPDLLISNAEALTLSQHWPCWTAIRNTGQTNMWFYFISFLNVW